MSASLSCASRGAVGRRVLQHAITSSLFMALAIPMHAQDGPPHDPELDAATAKMTEFENAIKANPADDAAKRNEAKTAIEYGAAERKENRMEAALWLLLRAQYWTPHEPELLLDLGIQEANLELYTDAASTLAESLQIGRAHV